MFVDKTNDHIHQKLNELKGNHVRIYIVGNPSTNSTRHVDAKVNTQKENQGHQNSNNKVQHTMLKRHLMPQIS